MMSTIYEKPRQPVRVFADFQPGERLSVRPVAFLWAGRRYEVKKINLVFRKRRGDRSDLCFAVSDEANAFVLSYNPDSMEWRLEEVQA